MKTKNTILLLITAFIWGTAFVAQSMGMDYMGPFFFNGLRNGIGSLLLLPLLFFGFPGIVQREKGVFRKKEGYIGGVVCGLFLFIASNLQQVGIQYTTVGKGGFITTCYIILVPLFGMFLGKKMGIKLWIGVGIALVGLYCLCITERLSINWGDFLMMLCAIVFSFHILAVDHFSPKTNGIFLAWMQFLVCGVLSLLVAFCFETIEVKQVVLGILPLLYAGVLSSGIGFTLQIIGQKGMNPGIASLILSLESTFSVIAGWYLLGERLSFKEKIGCVLMFFAILLVQIPSREEER